MRRHLALHFRRNWRPTIRRQLSRKNIYGALLGLASIVLFALLVIA